MANSQPLFYTRETMGKTQVRFLTYQFQITGAKTSAAYPRGQEILPLYDSVGTQAAIDAYLGTTNEFTLAQFDATAMGTDAFGGIINMQGQAGDLISVLVTTKTGANLATVVSSQSFAPVNTLTASTLSTGSALGANGNIAFRAIVTGLDALTSGVIEVSIRWVAK